MNRAVWERGSQRTGRRRAATSWRPKRRSPRLKAFHTSTNEAGRTFFAVSSALWPASRAAPSCASLNAPPPILGNAGGVGPSALSGFARLRLRRTSSTPRRCGLAFRASGPTAPGRPPCGWQTGAVEGARGNGEVPPKRRDSRARAGGDRARSARLTLFFARRASSEKGWVGSEAEAAGGPSKPSLRGWLCQAERWAGGEAPPAQIRLIPFP